jgi:Glycosyl hydrolase family 53
VQVGNEINDGMLWPEGRISTNGNSFANLAQLLSRGIAAVRDASPQTAVVLHIARGAEWGVVQWWLDGVQAQGVTWDYTGISYYPYWHGTLSAFQTTINNAASRYGKPVIVCETAYPFTLAVGDSQANNIGLSSQLVVGYPATEDGQRAMMKAIMDIVNAVPNGRGAGIFYWEGTWTPVAGNGWDNTNPASGNSWENQALFDFTGKALGSMSVFAEYPAWQATAFSALELADPAVSGDEADPDRDGLKNVLEFAFGTNPRSADLSASVAALPAPVVKSVEGGRYLTISFRRPVPAVGLAYTVLTADSPAGPWMADAVQTGVAVANGDGTETVVFRDSLPSDEPGRVRRFMKVEVTRSP